MYISICICETIHNFLNYLSSHSIITFHMVYHGFFFLSYSQRIGWIQRLNLPKENLAFSERIIFLCCFNWNRNQESPIFFLLLNYIFTQYKIREFISIHEFLYIYHLKRKLHKIVINFHFFYTNDTQLTSQNMKEKKICITRNVMSFSYLSLSNFRLISLPFQTNKHIFNVQPNYFIC